ncbi:sulfotransferase [Candidatus Neomarinimicrobiota bacterium]
MKDRKIENIFIVGVGRSGTSLLQNMLNSHRDIAFIPEIYYTRRFLFNRNLYSVYQKDREKFISYLKSDKWISRLDDRIFDRLNFEQINKYSFAEELYQNILSINSELNKKYISGDKDPRSIELVGKINKIIPNIHWIHIIRDPRDVLLSKMKADWSKDSTIIKHIFASYVQLIFAIKWKRMFPNTFTELYYEDLISNPGATLKTLCASIGIEYDSEMLNYEKSAKILIAKDEYSWKKEVFLPIIQSNQSKWKKNLDSWLIILVEKLVGPAFTHYHYNRSVPRLNIFQRLLIHILKLIFYVISKIFIWYRMK